jgi:hypothetical protein
MIGEGSGPHSSFRPRRKRPPTEAALLILTLPAHGQFTANDVRPPNNPAAKVLFPVG